MAAALSLVGGGCGKAPTVIRTDVDFAVPRDAAVAPVVDLAMSPCGACADPTPICDVKNRRCVACLADGDCPELTVCRANACVPGCNAGSRCGDAGSCDVDLGRCRGCLSDKECPDPRLPSCDVVTGRCGACSLQNDKCPAGSYCADQGGTVACVPGCKGDLDCQFGADGGGASARCCNHACVDTALSARNCGACGVDCMGGTCCGGLCAATDRDVKNCGACGKACTGNNAVPMCNAGVCILGGCVMGFADCNGNPMDGCETNVVGDVSNCGGCGKACNIPNANALCLGGQCQNGGCRPGFRDCDGNPANGCEVDVQNDSKNCGVCGQSCAALPNAVAGCVAGVCAVAACSPGFGNCDRLDNNGCEAPLNADPLNCGACGKVCPAPPNVATACVNQVCMSGGCAPGFADCNNSLNPDGCEARLATDAKNCGACGNACPAPPNATAGCAGGLCGVGACVAPFLDCDGNPANGCEANGNTDNANCGKCGTVCPNGTPCAAGKCGCIPAGRAAFNNVNSKTANGCWQGTPCAYDMYTWDATHGINFQAFGQQVTCSGAAPACVANVGITTYQSGGNNVCQGIWEVYCDNTLLGTISTLNKQCIGSAQNNGCSLSFGARTCTTIKLVAIQDNDATAGCCGGMSPDSMITGISAW